MQKLLLPILLLVFSCEEILESINDNKMYDLLGRELTEVPVGVMYIRNNKKYIRIK